MNKIAFQLMLLFSFPFTSIFSQNLNSKDLQALHSTIGIFLSDNEKLDGVKRSSEVIICLISIDTSGKVNKIHLLADEKNKDSTYIYLSRITASVFMNWKADNCKGKTIMIPLISIGQGETPEYVKDLIAANPLKQRVIENETKDLIVTTALLYYTPVSKN